MEVKPEGVSADEEAKESLTAQKPPLAPQIVTTGSFPAPTTGQGNIRPAPRDASGIVTTGFGPSLRGPQQPTAPQQDEMPGLEEQQASSEEISPSGFEQEATPSNSQPESRSTSRGRSRGQAASGPASGAAASGSTSGIQGQEGSGARGKRRRPSVPPTEEVVERRKQKRLAKNRVTAAASRERKRNQLASLEQRVLSLERKNSELSTELAARNEELGQVRGELASLSRGASGEVPAVRASESAALEEHALPLAHTLQPGPPPSTQTCSTTFREGSSSWTTILGLLHMVLLVAILPLTLALGVSAFPTLPALIYCCLEGRLQNHTPPMLSTIRCIHPSIPKKKSIWEHSPSHSMTATGCRGWQTWAANNPPLAISRGTSPSRCLISCLGR